MNYINSRDSYPLLPIVPVRSQCSVVVVYGKSPITFPTLVIPMISPRYSHHIPNFSHGFPSGFPSGFCHVFPMFPSYLWRPQPCKSHSWLSQGSGLASGMAASRHRTKPRPVGHCQRVDGWLTVYQLWENQCHKASILGMGCVAPIKMLILGVVY